MASGWLKPIALVGLNALSALLIGPIGYGIARPVPGRPAPTATTTSTPLAVPPSHYRPMQNESTTTAATDSGTTSNTTTTTADTGMPNTKSAWPGGLSHLPSVITLPSLPTAITLSPGQ